MENERTLFEISRCHCLVVNSVLETFSVVALEARAAGLHVISTRCGGPEETLDEFSQLVDSKEELLISMKWAAENELPVRMNIGRYSSKSVGGTLNSQYLEAIAELD
jgi:glycosyltransferase involved in cell wall biosynthesis